MAYPSRHGDGNWVQMLGLKRFLRDRGGVSLTVTLATSVCALLLVAVSSVLLIGLWSGAKNTQVLLQDKASLALLTIADKVETHLQPASNQVTLFTQLIASGQLDPAQPDELIATFKGGLAAAPQLDSILFIDDAYKGFGVAQTPDGFVEFSDDYSSSEAIRSRFERAHKLGTADWGKPLRLPRLQKTLLNYRAPVSLPDGKKGLLAASVSASELSAYLVELDPSVGTNAFILHDRKHVLAHPNLAGLKDGRSESDPLPELAESGDPVLAAIWQEERRYPLSIADNDTLKGHVLGLFGDEYVFIYRDLPGYSALPWTIGTYFRSSEVDDEFKRLMWAGLAGLATLVIALVMAIWLGRLIAQPVVESARAASRIGQLEISDTPALSGSSLRELNDQAKAFNTMLVGLQWFETYVPKKLVRRLMSQDAASASSSVERDITMMFTDIVGYSSLSEGIAADEIARLLNHHFAILSKCVEAEDGTVDKFIGDSVMAFWGAPDHFDDHADRAVRAAQAIKLAVDEDNKQRMVAGETPIRIRIGIHTGRVTVGNIGAPDRLNYTIIGDNVNIAQRLEQLGKQFAADAVSDTSVTTLLSSATADQLTGKYPLDDLGDVQVRGRSGRIRIYRLASGR